MMRAQANMQQQQQRKGAGETQHPRDRRTARAIPLRWILLTFSHAVAAAISFHMGAFYGSGFYECQEAERQAIIMNDVVSIKTRASTASSPKAQTTAASNLFPASMQGLFSGATRVHRDELMAEFDLGVPVQPSTVDNQDVLLLYLSPPALPNNNHGSGEDSTLTTTNAGSTSSSTLIPFHYVSNATENCHALKFVMLQRDKGRVKGGGACLAVMQQAESHVMHTWARKDLNLQRPLRPTSLLHNPPKPVSIKTAATILQRYLYNLPSVLKELRPLADRVAAVVVNDNPATAGVILVLVCNFGHADLLMNYVCAARSVGMDLRKVLIFCTDQEMFDLAESLGLAAFYDARIFDSIPAKAAAEYGTMEYATVMLSKVYCVHLINALGYDLVFQDVDITPHRADYLDYLLARVAAQPGFDLYLQYDPSANPVYAPWEANSGFYYAKRNGKTAYLFHSLLKSGDAILRTKSHQAVLTQLISEQTVLYGLRVKVLYQERNDFPVGFHFHKNHTFMKEMMQGHRTPHLFHMNWNLDKETKRKYNQQIGDWFVEEQCVGKTAKEIATGTGSRNVTEACCVASPKIVCHYRDKPSKIPCRDSPPADDGGKSFW